MPPIGLTPAVTIRYDYIDPIFIKKTNSNTPLALNQFANCVLFCPGCSQITAVQSRCMCVLVQLGKSQPRYDTGTYTRELCTLLGVRRPMNTTKTTTFCVPRSRQRPKNVRVMTTTAAATRLTTSGERSVCVCVCARASAGCLCLCAGVCMPRCVIAVRACLLG